MSGTITVGLDGSADSLAALDWAALEASRRGAELRLLHSWVWQPVESLAAVTDPDAGSRWAQNLLNEGVKRVEALTPGLTVTTEQLTDEPSAALMEAAGRSELLVLGSRGLGTFAGYLVGSVALSTLRRTERPVVLVREPVPVEVEGDLPRDEVVLGVGDTEESGAPIIEFAFAAASVRGLRLRAVRAWDMPPLLYAGAEIPYDVKTFDDLENWHRKLVTEALEPHRAAYPDVEVVQVVDVGSPSQVLLAHSGRADLVVVGRHAAKRASLRKIGSTTHALLHHVKAAIAVIPHA